MKPILAIQIKKLTPLERKGREPKAPKLYEALRSLAVNKKYFISMKEWKSYGYRSQSFRSWWRITKNQTRAGHQGSLKDLNLKIDTFKEGWVIQKSY